MNFLDEQGLRRLWEHIVANLGSKVDIEEGKVLSSNDYTTEEKNLLADLNTRVGETDVATQISNALANLDVETVVPDWNQNDETANDYIKNRTHWKEGEIVNVIENDNVWLVSYSEDWSFNNQIISNGDRFSITDLSAPENIEGMVMTVTFNGKVYTGTLQRDPYYDETYYIGNVVLSEWPEVGLNYEAPDIDGEDYCFLLANYGDYYEFEGYFKVGKFDTGTYINYPISVTIGSETYHKIDEKYLPDSIGNFETKIAELEARIAALEQITNDTFLTLNGYQN